MDIGVGLCREREPTNYVTDIRNNNATLGLDAHKTNPSSNKDPLATYGTGKTNKKINDDIKDAPEYAIGGDNRAPTTIDANIEFHGNPSSIQAIGLAINDDAIGH